MKKDPGETFREPKTGTTASDPEGSVPPNGEGGSPGDLDSGRETSGKRPTPVRLAMDDPGVGPEEAHDRPRTIRDPQEEGEWLVTEAGRAGSGVLPLRSVALLEVVFSRPEDPETPVRRALTQGGGVDELGDEELLALLKSSKTVRSSGSSSSLSKGRDRRRRGKRPPRG